MSNMFDTDSMSAYLDIMSNKQDIADEPAPGASRRERGLWLTTLATLAVFVYYFARVVQLGPDHAARLGALFVEVVAAQVAILVVGNALLRGRLEPADERDRKIAHVATRNAYYAMVAGVWCAIGVGVLAAGTFWVIHAALASLVLGELVRWATQLAYYRLDLQP